MPDEFDEFGKLKEKPDNLVSFPGTHAAPEPPKWATMGPIPPEQVAAACASAERQGYEPKFCIGPFAMAQSALTLDKATTQPGFFIITREVLP